MAADPPEGFGLHLNHLRSSSAGHDHFPTYYGTEFASKAMDVWAYQYRVQLDFIRPGKPVENSYIESFNGRLRDECLNVETFFDLSDVREKLERWRRITTRSTTQLTCAIAHQQLFAAQWTETAAPGPEPVPAQARKPATGNSLEPLT